MIGRNSGLSTKPKMNTTQKKIIIEAAKKKRFYNFVIDLIAIGILMDITFRVDAVLSNEIPMQIARALIFLGGYYIPLEYFFGKTAGKFLTKTRVVNGEGEKIDFRQAVIRYACRWLPFEFLSLGLGADAKAWHDVISKTHVIDEVEQEDLTEKIDSIG